MDISHGMFCICERAFEFVHVCVCLFCVFPVLIRATFVEYYHTNIHWGDKCNSYYTHIQPTPLSYKHIWQIIRNRRRLLYNVMYYIPQIRTAATQFIEIDGDMQYIYVFERMIWANVCQVSVHYIYIYIYMYNTHAIHRGIGGRRLYRGSCCWRCTQIFATHRHLKRDDDDTFGDEKAPHTNSI